jgi:hypothetical protein
MSTLKGLSPLARSLVTDDFRKGDPSRIDATPYVEELGFGHDITLAPLQEVIAEAMKRFPEHEPQKSDPWLGPRVHATVRLTRREAADKRIWEYLTVVEFPHYVRWRWANLDNLDKLVPQDRFFGEDSKNALARLWWASELTRNGSDYKRSAIALGISRFSVSWLHLILAHHRAAALAVVDFLHTYQNKGATDTQGQVMAKATNVALRTLCLDALAASPPTDAEAVRKWIAEKIDETTMMDELPRGPDEAVVPEGDIAAVRQFLDDLAESIQLADVVKTDRGSPGTKPRTEQSNEPAVQSDDTEVGGEFPAVGTPEWGRMNQRRAELIRKKNRKGLSSAEQIEYERLQRLSHDALETQFPRPSFTSESDGRGE